ncbi:VOC family protein [Propionibacterium sp.]|uniref:VOC family protein n=1 Tax=Propionibacterium sp. TaxID=1977903 RepID=UPI0039E9AF53
MTSEQILTPSIRTGAPTWVELCTHDPSGAAEFYSALFGWEFQDRGEAFGHYQMVNGPSGAIAGAMSSMVDENGPTETPTTPTAWTIYLGTTDAEATVSAALAAGGQILLPPMPIPTVGIMAVVTTPSGAAVGVWQPAPFSGFTVTMENSTPVWFEQNSTQFDADLDFYKKVFGWDAHDMPMEGGPRFVTNGADRDAVCGLYEAKGLSPSAGSQWHVYFAVTDCDEACEQAEELGGSVLSEPEDSPHGRFANLADPQGALFDIIAMP